jgi:hypothetical protein
MFPRITFGIIVLNGEPFTRYNLRSLYPWAHQIIVVEGACSAAAAVATPDGHSTDCTLEVLRRFRREEDPDNKLTILTAETEGHPNGFWPGEKHEMSQAYAKRATGDYLWQVDVDEFYRERDFPGVFECLGQGYTHVTFPMRSFWGGIDYIENGKYFILNRADEFRRLFRWGPGFGYKTHRPATVVDSQGAEVSRLRPLEAGKLRKRGIYLYHYSMLFPKQVKEKCEYYSRVDWARFENMNEWARKAYFELSLPYNVQNSQHCTLAWLERYKGGHPAEILQMIAAVQRGSHRGVELRDTADIDRLLRSSKYIAARALLRAYVHWLRLSAPARAKSVRTVGRMLPRVLKDRCLALKATRKT